MSDFENRLAAEEARKNAPVWTENNNGLDFIDALRHDGVGALLDMNGATTRAHLRKELASRFSILPPESGEATDATNDAARMLQGATKKKADEIGIMKTINGKSAQQRAQILAAYEKNTGHTLESVMGRDLDKRPPLRFGAADQSNMVTPEQYEKVVKLMADIELGRTNIVLETHGMDTLGKRDAMRGDLADIMQTDSGRALLGELAHRKDGHHTFINGGRKDAGKAKAWELDEATVSTAEYAAGKNSHHDQAELRSDVILYHELVHSLDHLNHTIDRRPITKGDPADKKGKVGNSEYHATGLGDHYFSRFSEGRYTEERQRIGKRNRGERTKGVADDDLKTRSRYLDLTGVEHYAD